MEGGGGGGGGGGGSYQSFQKIGRSSSAGFMIPINPMTVAANNGLQQDLNPMATMIQASSSSSPNDRQTPQSSTPIVREQDRFMPIANVIRIMRKVLPTHAKISDDAKETIQECVSEYISFITSEANERCQQEQRKTITAEDVLWAMSKLGFDDYIEPLSIYLQRYREVEGDHRGSIRGENLPPIKRIGTDMASCHMFGGPPPPFGLGPHHQHHHPQFHMYGGSSGMMGGGFYRTGGCEGSSQGGGLPQGVVPPLPPQGMPPFDPYGNGGYK